MDEQEVAAALREAADRYDEYTGLEQAQIEEPYGDVAGFVLVFPTGRFLVTVAQIGE